MDDAEMQPPLPPPPPSSLLLPSLSCTPSFTTAAHSGQLCREPQSVFTARLTPSSCSCTAAQLQDERGGKCSLSFLLPSFFSPPKPVLFSVLLLFCRPEGELSMTSGVQYPLLPPGRLTAQCEQKKNKQKNPKRMDSPCWFVCLCVCDDIHSLFPVWWCSRRSGGKGAAVAGSL